MCRMCDWMGDGQIWYLNPKNYAHRLYRKRASGGQDDLTQQSSLSERGSGPILKVVREAAEAKADGNLEEYSRIMRDLNEREARLPGWQVVPLKDSFAIMDLVQGPIAAMMCSCRKKFRGDEASRLEDYSCMGLGTGMLKWERWPERYRGGVEFLSPARAKEWIEFWDKRGYVHIIMQEGQDFIGGFCNCDYPSCAGIRLRMDYGLDSWLVKSEYVARVSLERCNGCGDCVQRCQFGALRFEVATDKANIDPFRCFGCGLCETRCPRSAIELVPRKNIPALRDVW